MEWIRTLIRDLVWILFPGGLLIIFIIWLIFGILFILSPDDYFKISSTVNNWAMFAVLLILSYITGQILRLRQLESIDLKCTEKYREKIIKDYNKEHKTKSTKSELEKEFNESEDKIKEIEKKYFANKCNFEELKQAYKDQYDKFKLWEIFPYPYYVTTWRLSYKHKDYNDFFRKYDMQGLTKNRTFFHFCKSVIYEYSKPFTEEVLRQESLTRLLSGTYYSGLLGKILNIIVAIYHSILIVLNFVGVNFIPSYHINYSLRILFICLIIHITFDIINREILRGLRYMRVKEIQLAYDGFYLICKKKGLNFKTT